MQAINKARSHCKSPKFSVIILPSDNDIGDVIVGTLVLNSTELQTTIHMDEFFVRLAAQMNLHMTTAQSISVELLLQ